MMSELLFTGERFIPGASFQIEMEHLNRYYFVINQIDMTNKVVLDLASGEGYGSNLMAKYAYRVIGIDISTEAIEHAKAKYIKNNLSFIVGNADEIPIPDNSIDVFVSFETIEHHEKHIEMFEEIKRVLTPDGILVISSPDKYYYSDLPQIKNDFHVKELYYNEFRDLLNKYFRKSVFFSQRLFFGSLISLDDENIPFKKPLIVSKDGTSCLLNPVYNIAIGTDMIEFSPTHNQVLYTEGNNFITKNDFDRTIKSVRNSKAYKIGYFLISPFRLIKKAISKTKY